MVCVYLWVKFNLIFKFSHGNAANIYCIGSSISIVSHSIKCCKIFRSTSLSHLVIYNDCLQQKRKTLPSCCPLAISWWTCLFSRARPIYRSADIRVKLIYRIGYQPPIKYRLSTITINSLFLRASTTALEN